MTEWASVLAATRSCTFGDPIIPSSLTKGEANRVRLVVSGVCAIAFGGLQVIRSCRDDPESRIAGLPVRQQGILAGLLVILLGVALVFTGVT